ncbi:hypothetical protein ACYAFX_15215 [Rhodococcus aetherivorans]
MHHSTSYRRHPRGSVATLVALPGSALRAGVRVAAAGAGVALDTAIVGAATAAGVGALLRAPVTAAAAPAPAAVVQLVADVARETAGGRPARRCAANGARTWIEVRGLDGPDGEALGDRVLAAIRDTPGVVTAELHRPGAVSWCPRTRPDRRPARSGASSNTPRRRAPQPHPAVFRTSCRATTSCSSGGACPRRPPAPDWR